MKSLEKEKKGKGEKIKEIEKPKDVGNLLEILISMHAPKNMS